MKGLLNKLQDPIFQVHIPQNNIIKTPQTYKTG